MNYPSLLVLDDSNGEILFPIVELTIGLNVSGESEGNTVADFQSIEVSFTEDELNFASVIGSSHAEVDKRHINVNVREADDLMILVPGEAKTSGAQTESA